MERVRGVGGVFFRSRGERGDLLQWYRTHLGIEAEDWGGMVFRDEKATTEGLVWSIFERDTEYFGDNDYMINFKVDDLDAMLAQLRDAGVPVDDRVEESAFGRFGWCTDPVGHRIELWQPPEEPPETS